MFTYGTPANFQQTIPTKINKSGAIGKERILVGQSILSGYTFRIVSNEMPDLLFTFCW